MTSRELVAASAEPMILALLAREESYGYAIIQEVRKLSAERIRWTDGMLYPVLHRLEKRGLIVSRWVESDSGRRRKYYSLKKRGRAALLEQKEQWLAVHQTLAKVWREQHV